MISFPLSVRRVSFRFLFGALILASTPLVNPGEAFELRFTAPATPGRCPFVCTFPGRGRLMQGTLVDVP